MPDVNKERAIFQFGYTLRVKPLPRFGREWTVQTENIGRGEELVFGNVRDIQSLLLLIAQFGPAVIDHLHPGALDLLRSSLRDLAHPKYPKGLPKRILVQLQTVAPPAGSTVGFNLGGIPQNGESEEESHVSGCVGYCGGGISSIGT